jgi:hypothetical protein
MPDEERRWPIHGLFGAICDCGQLLVLARRLTRIKKRPVYRVECPLLDPKSSFVTLIAHSNPTPWMKYPDQAIEYWRVTKALSK